MNKSIVSMHPSIRAYGARGFLLNGLSGADRLLLERAFESKPPVGFQEYVLGYDNLLILFVRPVSVSLLEIWLASLPLSASRESSVARFHRVPVVYDGPDLAAVASAIGLSEAEVIAIHSGADYTVRMMGFAPGFPYLDGLDPRLHIPRKASPRNHIEPGAVAIGGSHAGIYSVASPGGWHLLGRTELHLFEPDKAMGASCDPREVFAMAPGDTVNFIKR